MRLGNRTRIDIRMKTDDSFNIPWVTGSEFLPDGRLLVANTGTYRASMLGSDFKVEDNLSFSKDFVSVWDVAVVNETTAIVTDPQKHRQACTSVHKVYKPIKLQRKYWTFRSLGQLRRTR